MKALLHRYPLLRQLAYFGMIGTAAAITQLGIVVLLVELTGLKPLIANVIGFLFAFNVSYFGHRNFTFSGTNTHHHVAIKRLFIVAASNFIANEGLFYIFLNLFKIYYPIALLLVLLILPAVTFLLGKFWVFRS